MRQRWLLQGVVKNSKNLGGAKEREMKKTFKRRNRETRGKKCSAGTGACGKERENKTVTQRECLEGSLK